MQLLFLHRAIHVALTLLHSVRIGRFLLPHVVTRRFAAEAVLGEATHCRTRRFGGRWARRRTRCARPVRMRVSFCCVQRFTSGAEHRLAGSGRPRQDGPWRSRRVGPAVLGGPTSVRLFDRGAPEGHLGSQRGWPGLRCERLLAIHRLRPWRHSQSRGRWRRRCSVESRICASHHKFQVHDQSDP